MATGLVQAAWTLREIRKRCPSSVEAHLDWRSFNKDGSGLLLWEAFVSGSAKGSGHVDDADIAVRAFKKSCPRLRQTFTRLIPCHLRALLSCGLDGPLALRRSGSPASPFRLQDPTNSSSSFLYRPSSSFSATSIRRLAW